MGPDNKPINASFKNAGLFSFQDNVGELVLSWCVSRVLNCRSWWELAPCAEKVSQRQRMSDGFPTIAHEQVCRRSHDHAYRNYPLNSKQLQTSTTWGTRVRLQLLVAGQARAEVEEYREMAGAIKGMGVLQHVHLFVISWEFGVERIGATMHSDCSLPQASLSSLPFLLCAYAHGLVFRLFVRS